MLPYHSVESIASVICLMPDYFPRSNARLVSCYALFKWWLLPSQHPSCLCIWTSFIQLSIYLGTLADGLGCFPLGIGPYHPMPHSWALCHSIRSSSGFGRRWSPLAQLVALPLWHLKLKAAPKCISGSTSYLRVWLAFHPYPQLIQTLFNVSWFGPPLRFNEASPWPWVDHSVSRLPPLTNSPY